MNRWIQFQQPRCSVRRVHRLRLPEVTVRNALAPREGQSLTEFALVVPVILVLVMAIIAFGILFEDKIAMNNAARDGVRWATQNPDAWDNSSTAAAGSIQGQIQGEGATITIPNDDSHMKITYFTVTYDGATGTPTATTLCGSYDATNSRFDYSSGSTSSVPTWSNRATSPFSDTGGCLVPGNLIQVTVTQNFKLTVPIISRFFPGGVTLSASATMAEEAYPS